MNHPDNYFDLETVANKAMDGAKKRGASGVRVVARRSRNVSVVYRKGVADKVEESSRKSLNLFLYMNGKYTACQTNDLRDNALDQFLDASVAMCIAMTPDKYRTMPDPSLYKGLKDIDLHLHDAKIATVTPDDRNAYAAALEASTLDEAGKDAIAAEASYEDEASALYQVHSNGFEGAEQGTQFWSFSQVSMKDKGDKRPGGWAMAGSRDKTGLADPTDVACRAVKAARARMGASKFETQKLPMIIENQTVGRLMNHLLAALSGRALQQKASFLEGMVDKKFGSDVLDIADDPFVPGGFGSRLFDNEGIAAKQMPLFEKGVFRNFYLDTYYAKKLAMVPTTGSRSNIMVTPGKKDLDGLIAGIQKGVLVRGFVGGNSNLTTGDFSLGVYGTLIENGALTRAVAEMNIAGNHKDLWHRLVEVGNDPYPFSSLRSPSLLFDSIQFAGA
ncbi:MAG: TldD/PmbA family protein [Myxococcota bacterium]|nr:TldD/PmbA family protein [Myxococcota bacterium]